MNFKKKIVESIKIWDKFYDLMIFKIGPFLVVIFFIFLGIPHIYQSYVDKNYCVGSKEEFISCFEQKVMYKTVKSIYHNNVTSIYCRGNLVTYEILSCADFSNGKENIPITKINVGDTILKNEYSNEFSWIKNGEKINFTIDDNRDVYGQLKK